MNSRLLFKGLERLALLGNLKVLAGVGVLILIGVSLKDLSSGLLDLRQHIVVALLFAIVVDTLMVVAKVTEAKAKALILSKGENPEHQGIKRRAGRVVKVTAAISAYMNAKAFSSQLTIPDDVPRLTEIPFVGYPFKDFPLVGESFAQGIPLFMPLAYAIFLGCAVTFLIYLGAKFYEWNLYDPKIGPEAERASPRKSPAKRPATRRTSAAKKATTRTPRTKSKK